MTNTRVMTTCGGEIDHLSRCKKCGQILEMTGARCIRLIEVVTTNKAMSEAEKKWEEYDKKSSVWFGDETYESVSTQSREAYKAALRREIEKRIAKLNEFIRIANLPEPSTITLNRIDTLEQVLELLDTVEPTSESKAPKP